MGDLQRAFAANLARLANATGLSIARLAERAKVPESTLGDLLRGRWTRVPPWERVSKVVATAARCLPPDRPDTWSDDEVARLSDQSWWRSQHADLQRHVEQAQRHDHLNRHGEETGGPSSDNRQQELIPRRHRGGDALNAPRPAAGAARSRYDELVRQLCPAEGLQGRADELAMLARFVLEDESGAYFVLQAPPWTGKSALMAWFVLHPPPGVQVFSFFVTARFDGHDTRAAFTQTLVEQLAEFLSQPVPHTVAEHTREAYLSGLLADAVARCSELGVRMVLVVDGLDEDQGVTSDVRARSIAALLPIKPPPSLRVLVSSRPNPSIPPDVPDEHPLRGRTRVERLDSSSYAQVNRVAMERELDRLLYGSSEEQDLLGFVAVARGALTATDLADLIGLDHRSTRKLLNSVSGRTFIPVSTQWTDQADGFLLGHQELQRAALEFMGPRGVGAYHRRVREWALCYRERRWPQNTPLYLLAGFPRMLVETEDVSTLRHLATDPDRHNWMRSVSGSDMSAMAQMSDLQEVLLTGDPIDLPAMTAVACHLEVLRSRNSATPVGLSAFWITAGHDHRIDLLAADRPPIDRVNAVIAAIEALLDIDPCADVGGHINVVVAVADKLGVISGADTLGRLSSTLARHGRVRDAEACIDEIAHTQFRAYHHRMTIVILLHNGFVTEAASSVELLEHEPYRSQTSAAVTARTDPVRALAIAADIERFEAYASALADIACGAVDAGLSTHFAVIRRAILDASSRANRAALGWLDCALAMLAAAEGNCPDAVAALRKVNAFSSFVHGPEEKADLIRRMLRAQRLLPAQTGVDVVMTTVDEARRTHPLPSDIVHAVVEHLGIEQARRWAPDWDDPGALMDHTVAVARAAYRLGHHDEARRLVTTMHEHALSDAPIVRDGRLLGALAVATAGAGRLDTACHFVSAILSPRDRDRQVAELAVSRVQAGDLAAAFRVVAAVDGCSAGRLVQMVAEILPFLAIKDVARVLTMVSTALPDAGLMVFNLVRAVARLSYVDRLEAIAECGLAPEDSSRCWSIIGRLHASAGRDRPATAALERARALLAAIVDSRARAVDLARAEYVIARAAGELEVARQVGDTITDPKLQFQVHAILDRFKNGKKPALFHDPALDVADLQSVLSRSAAPEWRDHDLRGVAGLIAGERFLDGVESTREQCELVLLLLVEAHRLADRDRFNHFVARIETMALQNKSSQQRFHILLTLLPGLLDTGQVDKAVTMTGYADHPRERADLLVSIADQTWDRDGHALLARALCQGLPDHGIGVLLRREPSATAVIGDEVRKLVPEIVAR